LDHAFSKYDERKTNEMRFFKVDHIFKISTRSCVYHTQFRQDHFGLLEDGAPEAPKNVGAS
jgi:hypothetical protein